MNEIEVRAFKAYFKRFGKGANIPSCTVAYDGLNKEYLVLSNCNGMLAVYRYNEKKDRLKLIQTKWFETHILHGDR